MKKISVIVPVYNVEAYLRKCLDSLINQDFKDYEIIVVNDGSPDNSQNIILEYQEKYPKLIKAFKKENGGLSSARNFGLEKAKGEYVCFIDSDDYVSLDFLSKLYNKAIKEDADIVVSDFEMFNEKVLGIIPGMDIYSEDIIKNFILSSPSIPSKLFKKSLFQKDTLFPLGLHYEDLGTTPKFIKYTKKIAYLNEPLYKYLVREGSIMHQKKFNPKIADIFKVLDGIYTFYEKNNLLDEYKDEIEYLYINQLIHNFGLKFIDMEESWFLVSKIKFEMDKKFPNWTKNKYFKKKSLKEKIMCYLIYKNKIKLINTLRKK